MGWPTEPGQENNCGATLAGDLRERPFSLGILYCCISVCLFAFSPFLFGQKPRRFQRFVVFFVSL